MEAENAAPFMIGVVEGRIRLVASSFGDWVLS